MPDLVVFDITEQSIWQGEGVIATSGRIPPYNPTPEDMAKLRHPRFLLNED